MNIDEKNSNIFFFKASVLLVSCKTEVAYNKLLLLSLKAKQCNNFFAYYKPKLLKKKQHPMSAVQYIQKKNT